MYGKVREGGRELKVVNIFFMISRWKSIKHMYIKHIECFLILFLSTSHFFVTLNDAPYVEYFFIVSHVGQSSHITSICTVQPFPVSVKHLSIPSNLHLSIQPESALKLKSLYVTLREKYFWLLNYEYNNVL